MIGWVEASLYEAIDCLARSGKNHLASDLSRLLETLDFDELEVMRSPVSEAIANALLEVSTFPDLVGLLSSSPRRSASLTAPLHVVSEAPTSAFSTRALTTYPEEWVTRYVNRRYYCSIRSSRASETAECGLLLGHARGLRPAVPPSTTTPRRTASAPPATPCRSSPSAATRSPSRSARRSSARRSASASATTRRTCSTRRLLHHRGLLAPRLRGSPERLHPDRRPDGDPARRGDGRRRAGAAGARLPLRLLRHAGALDLQPVPHPHGGAGGGGRRPRRPPDQRAADQGRHPGRIDARARRTASTPAPAPPRSAA